MSDAIDLDRFVQAQDPIMGRVLRELGAGRKTSHWMWFVFPQLIGLGHSVIARQYAIRSLAEAGAYLKHPVLAPRLIECTSLVNKVEGHSAHEIFGSPDDLKFRSSMTLFASAQPGVSVFRDALDKYFGGAPDPLTTDKLARF